MNCCLEYPPTYQIALLITKAYDAIKSHEIEYTTRFSTYMSTKEFGSAGKCLFYYLISNVFKMQKTKHF